MEQEQARGLGRRAVAAAAVLALVAACDRSAGVETAATAESPRGTDAPGAAARTSDEIDGLRAELDAARMRIAVLEDDLKSAASERIEREQEWLRYSKALTQLSAATEKPAASFQPIEEPSGAAVAPSEAPPDPAPEPEASTEEAAAIERRNREIQISLRSLLAVEQVTSYDLLETGTLSPEGFTGPVVLRAFDDQGRPVGTLAADRLRLEGSRAARSLTIVLENGYEKRGGETFPFEGPGTESGRGGMRRIELPEIDPDDWITALAELFRPEDQAPPTDDGFWDLGAVRASLNLLLREDVEHGWWRLTGLGGVQAGVFRDVRLDQLDASGKLERKLFADRMQVTAQESGVKIELTDGAQLRGDAKAPFLDGRYRIFLPRASVEAWTKAGIPGLSAPPQPR
ncbi:MAG: hypothetical protein ACKVXR_11780 [Planctomycetota bacterium]